MDTPVLAERKKCNYKSCADTKYRLEDLPTVMGDRD